jgi:alkylation response protein AidB-like acyl-CoA dehydrogenase
MLGGMSALLAMTVEYLQNRQQFGRPIGQFQSLKHKAADMMLQVESAKTAVYAAACQADAFWQSNDDSLSHLKRAASIAQAYVSDAYCSLAGNAIQMHGAPGTTWEYAVHWYFKRAKCSEMLLGDAAFHRERLVMLYEEESE